MLDTQTKLPLVAALVPPGHQVLAGLVAVAAGAAADEFSVRPQMESGLNSCAGIRRTAELLERLRLAGRHSARWFAAELPQKSPEALRMRRGIPELALDEAIAVEIVPAPGQRSSSSAGPGCCRCTAPPRPAAARYLPMFHLTDVLPLPNTSHATPHRGVMSL